MNPVQVLISFFIAVLVTAIFAGFVRTSYPWKGFWIFLIIIFFVTLASSEYLSPIGPSVYGYYWVPGLMVAVIFAILLAAITPKRGLSKEEKKDKVIIQKKNIPNTYYSPPNAEPKDRIYQGDEPVKSVAWSGFLWVFIFLLSVLVIIVALIN